MIREGWTPLEEAKEQLGYASHSSLLKYCQEGRIEAVKASGRWVISPLGMRQAEEITPRGRNKEKKRA